MARRKQEEQKAKSAKTAGKSEGQWRPFHETIVEMLNRVGTLGGETLCLLGLIKITAIPAGHDKIIAAIEEREKRGIGPSSPYQSRLLLEVKNSLREQKRLAEEETALEKQVAEVMEDLMNKMEDLMKRLDNWKIKING